MFCLLALLTIPISGLAQNPQSDTQAWTEFDVAAALAPRIELTLPFILRTSTSLANPLLFAPGALVDFNLDPHLTLTGGYLFADFPNTAGGLQVHVPLAAATGRIQIGRLTISDRNRAEKLEGYDDAPIRYRNRFALDLASPPTHFRWHAFLTNEAFYDFSAAAWTQNRFQAGAGTRLSQRWSLDAYYLLRLSKDAHPGQVNVVGTTVTLRIR